MRKLHPSDVSGEKLENFRLYKLVGQTIKTLVLYIGGSFKIGVRSINPV